MTNADVTAAVVHAGQAELTLTTGGKDYIIDVPPGTPIVAENPGTRALVKKGAMVAISRALPGAGGAFTAKSITVTTVKNYPPK
jgi:GTPase involved in cell partitioning and DNA repair